MTARGLLNRGQHLFEHLQALPMRFHIRAKVGDLLSRLNTDIAEVQSMLTDAGFNFIQTYLRCSPRQDFSCG